MRNNFVEKAALKLNLPYDYVWEVYSSYWKFVRNYIASLPVKGNITREEFSALRSSVNVPSLGKFYIDWEHLQAKKLRKEKVKNERYTNKSN